MFGNVGKILVANGLHLRIFHVDRLLDDTRGIGIVLYVLVHFINNYVRTIGIVLEAGTVRESIILGNGRGFREVRRNIPDVPSAVAEVYPTSKRLILVHVTKERGSMGPISDR